MSALAQPSSQPTPSTLDEALHLLATERERAQSDRLEAVARLARTAAHDYNNLLSVINGYCEMLGPELAAQPDIAAQVAEIHKAGKKAVQLSHLLLSFGGKQIFHPQPVDFNALVHQHQAVLGEVLAASGASLSVETDASTPCYVHTDPEQFRQVLHHLITNSRDALVGVPQGLVVVQIQSPPESNHEIPKLILRVTDNGEGIDEAVRAHIFEPFFTTKPTGKGVGLGLSFVYGVIHRSGGTITTRTAKPQGTTVEITLPAYDPDLVASEQK